MTTRRPPAVLTVLAAVLVVLTGCTGVPSSSAPETIKPVQPGGASVAQTVPPVVGISPRKLVLGFLAANPADAGNHLAALPYLSPAARGRWSDTTVTIVDSETVSTYHASRPQILMQGRVIGTLNAAGIYTPTLQRSGSGGALVPFVYGIKRINGQYRIDSLRNGLVVTADEFRSAFRQRNLYFFDLAERYLVPDMRWSALDDSTQLATWLVTQLANGPRPDLQNAVNSDTLPTQASARRVSVQVGATTKVEIPGSLQLDSPARNRLAGQVGHTLADLVQPGSTFMITDGGMPVKIPDAGGAGFTASEVSAGDGPSAPSADVYYLRGGRIVDIRGKTLQGAVNSSRYGLKSVALSRSLPSGALSVAAVTGVGVQARLLVGTQSGGLHPTSVQGPLSRPTWAPGLAEVWVGDGTKLLRVTTDGRSSHVNTVSLPSAAAGGRIVAQRLSPEGSRIAIVIATANGAQQLFVGAVVRGAGQARVDTLFQVSPEQAVITDVDWLEPLNLFAIGYDSTTQDARIYDTGVDGWGWSARGIGQLPDPPDSVTVVPGQLAWVSAGGYVWEQSGSNWVSPGSTGQTTGRVPAYLE